MKPLDLIVPPHARKSAREALRRRLVHWIEGDNVYSAPGPPILIAEQPTHAPMKVIHGYGDPPVHIGRYCSINDTVTFMPGSEHAMDAVTTYGFYWGMGLGEPEVLASRGPITVGNDVWMGRDALIMSGITIGHGAVIAAGAVVTKDVAPYEITGGVPARHIGWRFDEQVRGELLKIAWWEWPVETVVAHREQLYSSDLVDFIARHGGKVDGMTSALHCAICGR
jgi:chloramphenicol O-acetyltransferase type B